MTVITIRQPGYLPHMGFFKKIQISDVFVYFDDAQYAIRAWDNRNKIRCRNEEKWITVPVIHPFKQKLNEVQISNEKNWKNEHLNLIETSYSNAPYFENYWKGIKKILSSEWKYIINLNIAFIEHFNKILDIQTKTVYSSKLDIDSKNSDKLLDICKKLGATTYQSGIMGKEYLDTKIFEKNEIKVIFENFKHPTYNQFQGDFISNMSIIDLIFNEGEKAKQILTNTEF